MNFLQRAVIGSACALGTLLPLGSLAQTTADHDHSHTAAQPSAAMAEGEVKKVDMEAAKVTIKHGEIKPLEMPGMTMAFPVKTKSLLARVKPGDKIKFMVTREGGKLVVTDIQPQR